MAKVELQRIKKSFGSNTIIPELNLEIESGEFVALVGPSGCGKSTLLRMIAGLEDPTSGVIRIGGQVMNDVEPKARGIAMVFQNYALYPHMTVRQNLGFALQISGTDAREMATRIAETSDMLGLAELLERKPAQLSGGQKQRVAMGRAMIRRPKVMLFDEPLSNLDAQLRVRVRSEIAHLHKKFRSTIIYVTHDQVEAMTLADRVAVLNHGVLEQYAPPMDVYRNPQSRFVASFIGTPSMNFLPVHKIEASVQAPRGTETIGFRPEEVQFSQTPAGSEGLVRLGSGKVSLIEPLGSVRHFHLRLNEVDPLVVELRDGAQHKLPKVDEETGIWLNPRSLFYFDQHGRRLGGEVKA